MSAHSWNVRTRPRKSEGDVFAAAPRSLNLPGKWSRAALVTEHRQTRQNTSSPGGAGPHNRPLGGGGLLRKKSCRESGSREPINANDFLPWHCLNLGELGRRRGVVETDTNQTLWKQRDYTSLPAPSILPQSATCRRQPAPPSPPLLFICFLLFVCPEAENSPCMLNSVSVRACVRTLWNDTLIHSVLYFLILLGIRASQTTAYSSASLCFGGVSEDAGEWTCLHGAVGAVGRAATWFLGACLRHPGVIFQDWASLWCCVGARYCVKAYTTVFMQTPDYF